MTTKQRSTVVALAVDQMADDVFESVDVRSRWYSFGPVTISLFTRGSKS